MAPTVPAMLKKMAWTEQSDLALAQRIARARKARGISLQTLADHLGVSKATAGHWETGGRSIKHHDLARLCVALNVSADDLLLGKRIWPFDGIDPGAINSLEPQEVQQLQGALQLAAAQIGINLSPPAITGSLIDDLTNNLERGNGERDEDHRTQERRHGRGA